MNTLPTLVILAAGRGSRFQGGGHKLTQALGDTTVLGATLSAAVSSGLPLIVVTTAPLEQAALEIVAARDVLVLPEVGSVLGLGVGRSITAGVSARSSASGWLVLPADLPLIQATTLRAVADALAQSPVAYAQFQGRRGHPVGFSAELYSELATLQGDEGARRLLARYPSLGVDVDDIGAVRDIDTVEDLATVRALWREREALATSMR